MKCVDVGLLIKESFFCGYRSGQIHTCCPGKGNTNQTRARGQCSLQNGKSATCVPYTKCHPFLSMMNNIIKPYPDAVPFIMQEVYLCGLDTEMGLSIPRICCPDEALAQESNSLEAPITTTESPTTTTTTTEKTTTTSSNSLYESHPGFSLISNPDTCGKSFVMSDVGTPKIWPCI